MARSLPFRPGVAGVDEAGRGPLAGPLVVAAVVLPEGFDAFGLDDSKKMTREAREVACVKIKAGAAWSLRVIGPDEVDRVNILRATLEGMAAALHDLMPVAAVVDGNQVPPGAPCPVEALVKGDGKDAAVAAASILAKVTRDGIMVQAHADWPAYGFDHNFGYGSPDHLAALQAHGPCPLHRRSFEPVKTMVNQPCLMQFD